MPPGSAPPGSPASPAPHPGSSLPTPRQSRELIAGLRRRSLERDPRPDHAGLLYLEDRVYLEGRSHARQQRKLRWPLPPPSRPFSAEYRIRSHRSGFFRGSPRVSRKVDTCMFAIRSISALPSELLSWSGCAIGCAAARRCLQERSADYATSRDRDERRLVLVQPAASGYVMHWLLLHTASNLFSAAERVGSERDEHRRSMSDQQIFEKFIRVSLFPAGQNIAMGPEFNSIESVILPRCTPVSLG